MSKKPSTPKGPPAAAKSGKARPKAARPPVTPAVESARGGHPNSKQAEVLRLLRRPEGATVAQICEATGWQPHTVRGAFAGTFKKRLGLTIASNKADGEARVYRAL